MKTLFYGIFLLIACNCLNHRRLNTNATQEDRIFYVGDWIISTLGLFRATLEKSGCAIRVQVFNNSTNNYDLKGKYNSPNYTGDCNQLNIAPGRLETGAGNQYLSANNQAYNHSTIFTIDDLGVMRLISTYIHDNRVDFISTETVINNFNTPNKYVGSFSQLIVTFGDRFEAFENQRGWKFIAQFGQLTIFKSGDPGTKIDYVYSTINIRDTRIFDFDNQSFPGAMFTNVNFQPRCQDPQNFIDFKPPYIFVANPYWPIVSVYEQGGYKIVQVAYSKLSQYDFPQNITEINPHRFYSPCPRRTFQYRGNCLGSCPEPYFHQMKGESGFCVLNCQEYSKVNSNRVCSCATAYEQNKLNLAKLIVGCPGDAIQVPYGCVCKNDGFFFDGKFTFTCVKQCPNTTFGINNICMNCPQNCLTCQRDGFNRQFFECTSCLGGYTISSGQCVPSCVANLGNSLIKGVCTKCIDPHCVDCSNDPNTCLKCDLLWTLLSGACVDNCSQSLVPQKSVYSDFFDSVCLPINDLQCMNYLESNYKGVPYLKCDKCMGGRISHLDRCVDSCPAGYYQINGYCTCGGVANLTINDQCLNQIACPIGMYFDIISHSCLSCPFGCISCIGEQCIACNPGYFLYVSPQNVLCRRKSPLFPCDMQYSWTRDSVCALINYTNPQIMMNLCLSSVPNCQICTRQNNQSCVLCQSGYFLYNNTCIKQCPQGLLNYMQTCILPQITNCSVPHLLSIHKSSVITYSAIVLSQAYKYYIYNDIEKGNDPVGYIPYFQDITSYKNDGIPRQSDFFAPDWICLKCNTSYGLSDDFKRCLPCPSQCGIYGCYMARNDSCLNRNRSNCGVLQYIDQKTQTCLQSCNSSQKYPQIRQGKLYCVSYAQSISKDYIRVDSAVYKMNDGQQLVFFAFNQKISQKASTVKVQSFSNKLSSKYKVGDVLTDNSTNSTNSTSIVLPSSNLAIGNVPSNLSSTVFNSPIINGQYVALERQTYNAYLMDLSSQLLNLTAQNSPIIFPSKVYGTVYKADHTVFMTTWLAYIGYIMSIVIILLHAVFIGNELLYKVDNLLIFVQTIFYFSYVKNLVGRLLAQFYFGWSFSHARFLPNLFRYIIPDHYVQMDAPISYKLVNIDGNYFRNAGFSLAWVLIYIGGWAVVTFIVWALINRLCRKYQSWYPRIAKQSLAAGVQFFSMNLIFFSVSQLAYSGSAYLNGFQQYFDRSQVLAIITIVAICIYTIVRFFFSQLGGLYMAKRIIIATILVFGYNIPLMIIPLICLEIIFAILRFVLEKPMIKFQKITIAVQCLLFIGCYILLFFCLDAGVNTIILSIIVFLFIVYLAYDLTTIYLESRNEFPEEKLVKQYEELASEMGKYRANTVNYINGNRNYGGATLGGNSYMTEQY